MTKKCSKCGQDEPTATHIVVIMDMSGSMGGTAAVEAMGAFNAFIAEQRKLPGKKEVSLTLFDNVLEFPYTRLDIDEVPELTDDVYKPRGCTALFDAIDSAVTEHRAAGKKFDEKTVFVIITDGFENASQRVRTAPQVKEIIKGATSRGAQFVFLAADDAAFAQGNQMGIGLGNSLNYRGDIKRGMITVSEGVAAYQACPDNVTVSNFVAMASGAAPEVEKADDGD